jgi:hypothetical protein
MNLREKSVLYREIHSLPANAGFVIFHRGEPGAWMMALSDANAREWVNGCVAVPAYFNASMFMTVGGTHDILCGSEAWARMDPIFETKGLI